MEEVDPTSALSATLKAYPTRTHKPGVSPHDKAQHHQDYFSLAAELPAALDQKPACSAQALLTARANPRTKCISFPSAPPYHTPEILRDSAQEHSP